MTQFANHLSGAATLALAALPMLALAAAAHAAPLSPAAVRVAPAFEQRLEAAPSPDLAAR